MITCFTPKADHIVGIDCHSLVTSLNNPDPKNFPEKMQAIVGKKHIFQFHFNTGSKQGPVNFILNEILDKPDPPQQLETKASGEQLQTTTNLISFIYNSKNRYHFIWNHDFFFLFSILAGSTSQDAPHKAIEYVADVDKTDASSSGK